MKNRKNKQITYKGNVKKMKQKFKNEEKMKNKIESKWQIQKSDKGDLHYV